MKQQKQTKNKSTKGRKPISYSKEDLERDPMLVLVCGETGVGKTYRTLNEIEYYMLDNSATGKKGRKVLVFDANDDDFPLLPTVSPQHVRALTRVQSRRIRPYNKDGSSMSIEEKRETVEKILEQYRNGLLILEDLDKYMVGAKGQSVIGVLTTNRHVGLDIMISHQSIAKVTTTEWQNATWLRIHHQVDDIKRYKERIPNYFLVRIACHIVDEQYNAVCRAFDAAKINYEDARKYKGYFVYINIRKLLIRGCSKEAFIRAAKKFIDTEETGKIRLMLQERDKNDKPIYPSRKAATIQLISDYLRYWENGEVQPFTEEGE